MRKTFFSMLVAVTGLAVTTQAAAPSSAAQRRAEVYKRAVWAAFDKNGWAVVEDKPGQIAVEHKLRIRGVAFGIYNPNKTYAHLTISFLLDSATHTDTSIKAEVYVPSPQPGMLECPPQRLTSPEVAQVYLGILQQAEAQMAQGNSGKKSPVDRASNAKNVDERIAANF